MRDMLQSIVLVIRFNVWKESVSKSHLFSSIHKNVNMHKEL